MPPLSRRGFLRGGAGAFALGAAGRSAPLASADQRAHTAAVASAGVGATLADIRHVIIFVQENRSFDHYFGTYKGVRGFDDRSVPGGAGAFAQGYPTAPTGFPDPLLPWHLDTSLTTPPRQGECTNDIEHQWAGQHDTWNAGACDRWMVSHLATESDPRQAAVTMGYYTRADLPFYFALADHFTICDNYFCSVIAGTDVNRLYSMTGTLDPDGWDGGCQFLDTNEPDPNGVNGFTIQRPGADLGTRGRWVPYPELLTRAGITWKVYSTPDGHLGDNVLRYFPQFRPVGGDPSLSASAFSSNGFPDDFVADCLAGRLPQVTWLLADLPDTEHAPAPPTWGESVTHDVLTALFNSPAWPNSVMFFTYDENGGFFDHVPPLTAPAGTPGEFLDPAALSPLAHQQATTVNDVPNAPVTLASPYDFSRQPIGLGFRVPTVVVSPFTRNPTPGGAPQVCSDRFDHTSLLRFLETWTAAIGSPVRIPDRDPALRRPGLSAWRRANVGDLTSALNLAVAPDTSVPTDLVSIVPNRADPRVLGECTVTGTLGSVNRHTEPIVRDPVVPPGAMMPRQEAFAGAVRRPSGVVASPSASSGSSGGTSPGSSSRPPTSSPSLPATGGVADGGVAAALAGLAAAALVLRRRASADGAGSAASQREEDSR